MQEILPQDWGTASNQFLDFSESPMSPTTKPKLESFIYEWASCNGKKVVIMRSDLKSFIDFIDEDITIGWRERIEQNPKVLVGKPVVTGTRISVDLILEMLSNGWSETNILDNYPQLELEDIRACISYAGYVLRKAGMGRLLQ